MQTRFFLFCLFLGSSLLLQAQIESPQNYLPTRYTENFTPHHEVVDYFQYVADNSERVRYIEYGRTNEDRPLTAAFVTSPENMARLEDIRLNNLRQTGLTEGSPDTDNAPAVVWLSFGVHGNEAGASESSMQTLYELVTTAKGQKYLETTVVIFDPSLNPDGYSRYSHWYRGVANETPDPRYIAREHQEPWPGGRVNHYLFDLNRDWAWATQVETQQRLTLYHQWMPHIHVDLHEQYPDNPYYFAPAAAPLHKHITPFQYDFQTEIGKNNASYFDEEGWLYFTREIFDLFYPSYGDTYPTFNGAVGMTYEQAGHGISGRAIDLENGDTLHLHDRIDHHKTTALSTVEVAAANAQKLNREFVNYFKNAQNNPPGDYKTYIISGDNPRGKIKALTELLDKHNIRYGSTDAGKSMRGFAYRTGENVNFNTVKNDLVISAHQPMGLLTQVLFEPESALEDSLTYDITAWALPYAYGLKAYAVQSRIDPTREYTFESITNDLKNAKPYAYFAQRTSARDLKFLGSLLQNDIRVRYAEEDFAINGKKYAAGTLVILRADNEFTENFHATVRRLADEAETALETTKTGFADSGHDLGADAVKFIKHPNIALLGGEKTNPYSFGHTWHYFERDLGYPVTVIKAENFKPNRLTDFNVLVMPDGRYGFGEDELEEIAEWVGGGGRVIALGNANAEFADKANFGLSRINGGDSGDDNPLKTYGDRERRSISSSIPGAIYEVRVDKTHPLGFGLGDKYFALKVSSAAYDYLDNGWNVGHFDENPRSVGFTGYKAKRKIKNSLAFGTERKGRGKMIYLIDNPLFRGFWEEGKLLMGNAVFF